VANVWLTPEGQATTNVELLAEDADWLVEQLGRISDPSDTPAAQDAADRIRAATADAGDHEIRLSGAELDAIRRVFELEPEADGSETLGRLRVELGRWVDAR
jgi:hypothetical protein